jgi:hypothetical protein
MKKLTLNYVDPIEGETSIEFSAEEGEIRNVFNKRSGYGELKNQHYNVLFSPNKSTQEINLAYTSLAIRTLQAQYKVETPHELIGKRGFLIKGPDLGTFRVIIPSLEEIVLKK